MDPWYSTWLLVNLDSVLCILNMKLDYFYYHIGLFVALGWQRTVQYDSTQ